MNETQVKILNFLDNENDKSILLFIEFVKNYYYNNDLPNDKECKNMKEWFKLNNLKEIEDFLKSISDEQYDQMIEMIKINTEVGSIPHRKKCNLPIFMGSLDKIKTENDYNNWKNKSNNSTIIVSEKLDGISALLIINDNKELKLCTRGNGRIGCDISHLIKYLNLDNCIDNTIKYFKNDIFPIIIRGELIIKKNKDEENLRNVVSGLVHTKEITQDVKSKLKYVDFVAYRIFNQNMNYKIQLETLSKINYKTPQVTICLKSPIYEDLQDKLISFGEKSEYQIDGIVVSYNLLPNSDPLDKNPDHSIAIKNTNVSKQTEVIEVQWNISKHGVYKPRVRVKQININGSNIEWVTGFNAKYINDNNIGKGTILEVERSGDVIPNIKTVIKSTKAELPNTKWKWNKTEVDILIDKDTNDETLGQICDEMEIKKLLTFFQELECPHLGPKTIEILYNNGFKTVLSILKLTKKELLDTEKFKDKSATNLLSGIEVAINYLSNLSSKNIHVFMYATGAFGCGFGSKKIKLILDKYPYITEQYNINKRQEWIDKIKEIKGISEQADLFVNNITKYNEFIETLKEFIRFKLQGIKGEYDDKPLKLIETSETVVFTGFRDKILKEMFEDCGYNVNDNITKETTIVVYVDENSSKYEKAKKMGMKLVHRNDIKGLFECM